MSLTRLIRGGGDKAATPIDRAQTTTVTATASVGAAAVAAVMDRFNINADARAGSVPARLAGSETTLPVVAQRQVGNACGTTSLSMVLTYFGAPKAVRDVSRIDAAIRPSTQDRALDSFTAPIDLARYANRHGFRATLRNDTDPQEIVRLVDQGVPPLVLYDTAPNQDGTGLHYVVVSGYKGEGADREWTITDPAGYTWHQSHEDFMKSWSNLKVNGIPIPYNRLMITVAPTEGMVKRPDGNVTPAQAVKLPQTNSSAVVDWAGGVAVDAIGLATRVYDGAQSVRGAAARGSAWLQQRLGQVGGAVVGALQR